MENKIDTIDKEINKLFNEKIKGDESLTAFYIAYDKQKLSVAYSGSIEDIYTAFCHFLFEQPDLIEVLETSIECAKDFHSEQNSFIIGQTKGDA